jgi:hypothetical protein
MTMLRIVEGGALGGQMAARGACDGSDATALLALLLAGRQEGLASSSHLLGAAASSCAGNEGTLSSRSRCVRQV